MLDDLKLIHERDPSDVLGVAERQITQLDNAALKRVVKEWAATVPTRNNLAKQLALDLIGKTVVVHSSDKLAPVLQSWQLGMNGKVRRSIRPQMMLYIRSSLDDSYEVEQAVPMIVVDAVGKDLSAQILWASVLGDFTSIYAAILEGVNPTAVDLQDKLKLQLA